MRTRARNHASSRPIEREVQQLRRDVDLLRGGLISVLGEDPEGEYQSSFVAELLRAVEEKPTERSANPHNLQRALRRTSKG